MIANGVRKYFPVGRAVVKVPPVKEVVEYLMEADDGEELQEQIAIARQKIEATRKDCGAVPITLQIDLERLIESRRTGNDPNFNGGRT